MSRPRFVLLIIMVAELFLIGMRYQKNGAFSAPVKARVNKLERGNRLAVRQMEADLDAQSIDDWVNLGQVYSTFALMPEAEYCFRRAVNLGSLTLEQQFKYGVCLSRRGKIEKAIQIVLPVANSNNELAVHANQQIGFDYLRLDRRAEAEKYLRKAGADPISELSLARVLIREDRVAEAIRVLDGLITRDPDSMRAHQMRAWAYKTPGDTYDEHEARVAYDNSMHASGMVIIHPLSRDWDVETVSSMGAAKHMTASSIALQKGEFEKAISEGELALEMIEPLWRPGYAKAMINAHLANDEPVEALDYLSKWLIHDGESTRLWELVGDAFLALGEQDQAEAAWLRGTRIRASKTIQANAEICRKLDQLYQTQGNEAQATIFRAWHQYESGKLQWRDNNVRSAVVLFTQASDVLAQEEQVWFYLAESQRALNDRTSARESYKKCLLLNKHHGRAIVGLSSVN
jgi:tetratricopeptide (TPR) repeat protein